MARRRYTAEQIIGLLLQADVGLSKGRKVPKFYMTLGIHEVTYYRWRREYGGRKVNQAKQTKELVQETARLKRIVASQAPNMVILKAAANPNL